MEQFAFHPELFELRNLVMEQLADEGFLWLSHFGSVDLMHDIYGLEVCGIHHEDDAHAILSIVRKMFPSWRHTRMYYVDYSERELGWRVNISRDPEEFEDKWQRAT
jgi:hypothetical protein